jgi:hypothetical protein
MIGIKRIKVQRHMDKERFIFQKHETKKVLMLTMKRKTQLVTFLIILCQYAVVDSINFLPFGIILYSIGIAVSIELLSDENALFVYDEIKGLRIETREEEVRRLKQLEEEELQRVYDVSKFEYHVFKKRPRTKFFRIHQNDGRLKLFAV